ncbi:helix-turn-helix domain-containing protein [Thalassotalea euphylliae]|uniref:Helix-turn-helix domain-containing protein n=1 Tax=Thalassotalea euphylliae TaxID=1655234 RepID=A0A3E0U366_9GAMM|nr:helix-turn-helix domain-containing protein [Thalassotalea euphylliae]REL31037.1 helix-turn-helix domain-containing protein [Thalassotalea euphylliae]
MYKAQTDCCKNNPENSIRPRYFRKENGWSQDVLAKASGLSLRTIQRLEKDGNASSETLLSVAAALNKPQNELLHISEQIETLWKWRSIMQNVIALIVIIGAIGMLFVLGGELGMFADHYSALFLTLFTYACTVVAFGPHGFIKSITGLKYLFSENIPASSYTTHLAYIYKKQLVFTYAGSFIAFITGAIAILSNQASIESLAAFNTAWAICILIVLYAAIVAEGVFRPLIAKLDATQLMAEIKPN